jgi:4-hydroxy-tetrahydrodipicolinate synthase
MAVYEGVHVALLTAFGAGGALDHGRTAALACDLIDRGIHGIVVNGSTGEFASLTTDERREILDTVLAAADGRVPVTAQIGAMTTAETVENAEHALKAGAIAGMVVCPYYEAIDDREIEAHYRDVARVGLPIMIYNNPGATGWSMSPDLIRRLAEIHGVDYLKDTTPDATRIFRIRSLVGDRLELLSGQDSLTIATFLAGGTQATVWGAPNAVPEACLRLWELTVALPDPAAARKLWADLFPVLDFFESHGYTQAVRAATNLRGQPVGDGRAPVLAPEPSDIDDLAARLRRLDDALR